MVQRSGGYRCERSTTFLAYECFLMCPPRASAQKLLPIFQCRAGGCLQQWRPRQKNNQRRIARALAHKIDGGAIAAVATAANAQPLFEPVCLQATHALHAPHIGCQTAATAFGKHVRPEPQSSIKSAGVHQGPPRGARAITCAIIYWHACAS